MLGPWGESARPRYRGAAWEREGAPLGVWEIRRGFVGQVASEPGLQRVDRFLQAQGLAYARCLAEGCAKICSNHPVSPKLEPEWHDKSKRSPGLQLALFSMFTQGAPKSDFRI